MRRYLLLALAALAASCAAPQGPAADEIWLGPPMALELPVEGHFALRPPADD